MKFTPKQQYAVECLWFIYGNNGKRHTKANHKFLQRHVEGRHREASFHLPSLACRTAFDKIMAHDFSDFDGAKSKILASKSDKIDFTGATCEEASLQSRLTFIPCGNPAQFLVKNRDPLPYLMCVGCADHNVKNRGAKIIASARRSIKSESVDPYETCDHAFIHADGWKKCPNCGAAL